MVWGAVAGAVIGGIAQNQSAKSAAKGSTTTSDPWSGIQPYLNDLYFKSQRMYNQFTPSYYSGQTFAPQDPLQIAAQQAAMKYVTGSPNLPDYNMPDAPKTIPTMGKLRSYPFHQDDKPVWRDPRNFGQGMGNMATPATNLRQGGGFGGESRLPSSLSGMIAQAQPRVIRTNQGKEVDRRGMIWQ